MDWFEGRIAVATSERPLDDPIAAWCADNHVTVVRGSASDVAGRFLKAANVLDVDAVARINADGPLVDPELVAQGCREMVCGDLDFVTNIAPRSYPYGIAVEIVRRDFFSRCHALMSDPHHFEHVTSYIYDNLLSCRFRNLESAKSSAVDPEIGLTVDLPEHLERFRSFAAKRHDIWSDVDYKEAVAEGGFGRMPPSG